MKVLIVGLGSIARKHIESLRLIEPGVEVIALRSKIGVSAEVGIENIYSWAEVPRDITFIIISNPTSEHASAIEQSVKYKVPLFIEKPPLMSVVESKKILELVVDNKVKTYTAFNLRFHPVIKWLKENLQFKQVYEVQAYCGSYLPDWRPGTDYRTSYSAWKALGGGAHLDLIHELDYLVWLFGIPEKVKSELSKISSLEIDSIDSAQYQLHYDSKCVFVLLNYFRRDPKRQLEIVMEDETWTADLLAGTVRNSAGKDLANFEYTIKTTYNEQMKYFLDCIRERKSLMNSLTESIETLKICLHDS